MQPAVVVWRRRGETAGLPSAGPASGESLAAVSDTAPLHSAVAAGAVLPVNTTDTHIKYQHKRDQHRV